jgi:hypothetical protein
VLKIALQIERRAHAVGRSVEEVRQMGHARRELLQIYADEVA